MTLKECMREVLFVMFLLEQLCVTGMVVLMWIIKLQGTVHKLRNEK